MRYRIPEIFLGAFLSVAIFAMGMLFVASYNPHPSSQNPAQHAEATAQNESSGKTPSANSADASQHHEQQEAKSEFWSAKLSDWALVGFTGLLVLFTYRLWKSTEKLWESTKATVDLAREEFISTHRPKIIVYGLNFSGDVTGDQPVPISFRYVNSGDSDAVVTGFGTRIIQLADPLVPAEIEFTHQEITSPIEVPSGMHGFRLTPDTIRPDTVIAGGTFETGSTVCIGVVLYRDRNGTRRQTGFCRKFDFTSGRWVKMHDDEYEYSY